MEFPNDEWRDENYAHLTVWELEEIVRRQSNGFFFRGEPFMEWVHRRIKYLKAIELINSGG